jgi:hypothetical protein
VSGTFEVEKEKKTPEGEENDQNFSFYCRYDVRHIVSWVPAEEEDIIMFNEVCC